MIILEGPDGAGKSTLAAQIERDWGITREPRVVSAGAETQVDDLARWTWDQLEMGFGFRLYDRFSLISSPQYTMLENRTMAGPLMDYHFLRDCHARLRQIDPVIIWCLPPLEVVKENLAREDDSGRSLIDHIETLYLTYTSTAAMMGVRDPDRMKGQYITSQMVWDYTKPNTLHLANLLRWAKARTEQET